MSDPLGVRKKLVKYQGRAITDEEWLKFVQMTEESINKDPSWICVCLCLAPNPSRERQRYGIQCASSSQVPLIGKRL